MINHALKKTAILFGVTLLVMVSTFAFAVWYHEDSVQRVEFSLSDQKGQLTTEKDLAGRHLLVFFGYTSCPDICPGQLYKLSQVMTQLEATKEAGLVVPVFITVDPERDTPEKLDSYLTYFHDSLVGLTGSRASIKKVTDAFSTLLQQAPEPGVTDYMVAHSSQVYVVDQYGRIVDFIPFNAEVTDIVGKVKDRI
ncbi:MAG: SCO family protein [Arenicella sp.]